VGQGCIAVVWPRATALASALPRVRCRLR